MDRLNSNGQMIDQVDLRGVPHSAFDRSNHNYGSGKLGTLIPARLDEVYPGDRIKGKPQIVENFEPLAAPLMGTMILKQESFFVPYIQLWRHAWKFFTGKNGFDQNMPSISPGDIFEIYYNEVHGYVFGDIGMDNPTAGFQKVIFDLSEYMGDLFNDTNDPYSANVGQTLDLQIKDVFRNYVLQRISTVYGPRKMYDLVQPALDILKRFVESDELKTISKNLESSSTSPTTKIKNIYQFASAFGNAIEGWFNFFHGPSSLFDYLGWPVPITYDLKTKQVDESLGINLTFGYFAHLIMQEIIDYGYDEHKTLYQQVSNLFSQVPLVFNPFKAYYLIWYWNYRDQLLETGILDPEEDEFLGSTITPNVVLYCTINRQRCWLKDTFTTALTNTGDGNLLVPSVALADPCNVEFYNSSNELINTKDGDEAFNAGATICKVTNGDISYSVPMNYLRGSLSTPTLETVSSDYFVSLDMFDRIRRLRNVIMKRSILGYEVDDVVYSSFLVKMSNVRMHIPEILSRGRDIVQMNTVVNNTSTAQQIAGDKTATAWCQSVGSEMNYFSEDWGLFLTIKTTMPIQSYALGLQRLYLKTHNLDYMWPEFAAMGMDAVYNTELAALGSRLTDEQGLQVFGYQGRYYDLKSRQDEVHGRLLTDLNYLTFSRKFDSENPPQLNYIFVHCWPRLDGFVIEDPAEDVFRYDCYNESNWERRLPVPSEFA